MLHSLLIRLLEAELNEGDQEDDHEERPRHRRGVAQVEALEAVLVEIEYRGQRGVVVGSAAFAIR